MSTRRQSKSTVLSQYFAEIRDFPLLTKDEERQLARDIREGKQEALNELVESNLSFVAKVASEYRSMGLPFEDLLNEGNVGLIEAAHRFDASKDTKFISYAIWWIRKSILKALAEQCHVVRLPYSQMKKMKEIRRAEKALRRELGRKPDREEISQHLSKSVTKIDRVLQNTAHQLSLDEPVSDENETPLTDCLVDRKERTPEERMLEHEMTIGVGEAFRQLNGQQRAVIEYRFGLNGQPCLTLQETGERMGLSRERVRQIECQAKVRIHRMMCKRNRFQPPPVRLASAEPDRKRPSPVPGP